jgi:two-component system cell cycle sensor histidine kinase/response regulator CckA
LDEDGQISLWQRLVGPSPRIQGAEQRVAARLMAVLMLAHVAAIALGLALGDMFWRRTVGTTILRGWDAFGVVVCAGLIAVSFLLVRAGRYRTGVALYLACTAAVPLTVPFLGAVRYEIAMLAAGIIPVLIAAIAMSYRWVLGVLASILVIGMVELLVVPLPPSLATTGFGMLLVVLVSGVLVLVLRHHQSALGRIRLRTMHASEHAARRSEQHYRTLFETVSDGIFLVRRDEKLIEINNAACRQLGYAREELLGMPLAEIVAPEAREHLAEIQRELFSKGFVRVEGAQQRKDGSTYPVDLTVSMTELDGAHAFMGVARDITERRRAEADRRRLEDQLQHAVKMESIGRLAGGVAHDFNNLLTVILGNLEIANQRLLLNESVQDLLGEVREAAMSAAGLTRQLLAFSRRQIVEPRLVDLNELIAGMHKMLARLIGEDIELRTLPDPGLATVKIDPGLAEQVLVNLAVNARDAMPRGGVLVIETSTVTLDEEYQRSHPLAEPGAYVRLAISDTGCGMSDEVKSHLFEPFFTTKPRGEGTGLGLATTYGAIRQSNGHIEVYSEVGKGTTFKIYLPARSETPESLTPPLDPRSVTGGSETILVVEDDERVRNIATQALLNTGYRVLAASDGEAALAIAGKGSEPIHLLLTDVVMPGMNGRQLAERLVQVHPETRILFTSGYTENIIAHHGVLDRGIEFLSKPYTLETLTRRVREILDQAPRGPASAL